MHRLAIERNPAFAVGHYNLGCVLFARRRFAEAEFELREALRLDPGLAQAKWYLEKIRSGPP
jgi:tetratricopeptide (TPR) repeat protein